MASVLDFVRGVDFSRVQFQDGQLEEKTREMSNLRWLRLNRSNFKQLPQSMDCFSKLEVLTLARNDLQNLDNAHLSDIQSLRILNVNHNDIEDSGVPSDIFTIRDLATLDLSHNRLGRVPEDMAKARNMIVLSLGHNSMASVPGTLFVHCSDIQHMDFCNNKLQSLPPQLRRLEHLHTLNLANNPLQHYTFKNIDKLCNLTCLNLSNTGRDFNNTPNLDKLVSLTDLDMSHNNLSRIPEPVYLLEQLQRVYMSHNNIKELSSLIDTWQLIVTLDLSFNQISALHPNICKCVKLKRLFLNDNRLSFEGIPAGIGKLAELEHFVAARNQLECIPEGICRLYSLKRLILTSNCLVTLPEGIHFLKLEKLDIDDNPNLVMPAKPKEKVKGSGAEWYNIDFDPEILKMGAVVNTASVIKGVYVRQKERRLKIQKSRRTSTSGSTDHDEAAAQKVLKGLAVVAEQRDVLLAGAGVEMVPNPDAQVGSPVKHSRWDVILRKPDLDYSEIFSEDVGSLPGLSIWQMESFCPVEVDEAFHGQLYIGDCYIVLKTYWNDDSELDWSIFFWIGSDASLDKCASAAMHAIHLRNMLGASSRTHRQEHGEEDREFLELFPMEVTYIEGGTVSGFYTVEEEDIPIRLFKLCGVKRPFLQPVDTLASSLDMSNVFLLDAGPEIFIWCGSKSPLMSRSKARLIADKIKKHERKNKCSIFTVRAGIEADEFWEILGEPLEEPVPLSPVAGSSPEALPILYKAGLGQGYLELPQVNLPQGKLHQSLLHSSDVYILDCHSDIFLWIGRKSARILRAASLKLAQELLDMVARPSVAMVTRCQEGMEPQIFCCRFDSWDDVLSVDFTQTPEMLEKKAIDKKRDPLGLEGKKAAKVDLSPLFVPREVYMPNREAHELTEKWNTQLLTMRCCVIEGKKFSILSNREKGHFYTAECYFFLCRYTVLPEEKELLGDEEEGEDEEAEEEEQEVTTVVYFWQGREASNMGWLHFTHGIQKQLERAMDGPIDVIRFKQQQENLKFLSHFGGKFIIHRGHRDAENVNPSLYQIRAASSKLCRRVVQVPAKPISLNSCFCHILKVPFEGSEGSGIVYIWIGSQTSQEEAIHAEQMGRTMFESSYSNVVINEGSEPENFFWVALGGKDEYEANADFMKHSRLFRCSNAKGFFAVSEKCSDFCQEDLSEDDVMMMDNGTTVFIWFGKNASEMEKKLSLKSAQVYLKYLAEHGSKRKFKIAKHGAEPWDFIKCFHGWIV